MSQSNDESLLTVFTRKVRTAFRKVLNLPRPLEEGIIHGRKLILTQGMHKLLPDDLWLKSLAEQSEIVFDVGANIGQSALTFLVSDTIRQIVLIEANPHALALAAQHLVLNDLSFYARFISVALTSEDDQTVDFWTIGTGSAGSIYPHHARSAAKKNKKFTVRTLTLDTLCDQLKLTPDLVKIDVEGAEVEVLKGAHACASRHKTRFMVEIHSTPVSIEANIAEINAWCNHHNYIAWHLARACPVTELSDIKIMEKTPNRHILLQPAGWDLPRLAVSQKMDMKL